MKWVLVGVTLLALLRRLFNWRLIWLILKYNELLKLLQHWSNPSHHQRLMQNNQIITRKKLAKKLRSIWFLIKFMKMYIMVDLMINCQSIIHFSQNLFQMYCYSLWWLCQMKILKKLKKLDDSVQFMDALMLSVSRRNL